MKQRYGDGHAFDIWIELLLCQLGQPEYLEAAADQSPELHEQYMICAQKVEDELLYLRSGLESHLLLFPFPNTSSPVGSLRHSV